VIARREVPRPEARELRACGLAALAEAGVLYLPAHLVLTESRGFDLDPSALAVPFVLAYVAGTLIACRFRASRNLATGALILAVLVGLALGRGDPNRTVFTAVVAMLVALRAVSLGVRDWRTPLHGEIGWGAAALGIETIVASGAETGWRPLLVVFVPLFFVASLASRASTVWTSGGADDLDESVRAAWIRRAVLATGVLVGAMLAAVALSVRGGLFDRIGVWLTPAANAFVDAFAWLLGQAARPFFWLVDLLGIDPERVREFFDRLRRGALGRGTGDIVRPDAALWQRVLGLLVFVAVGYAIYRLLRRRRHEASVEERPGPRVEVSTAELEEDVGPPSHARLRRELPAEAVRRWYAEVLLALRAKAVRKEPSLTPAEFVPEVAASFPDAAEDFRALTRAYEDVRYGGLLPDRERLRGLESGRTRLLSALRSRRPPPVP